MLRSTIRIIHIRVCDTCSMSDMYPGDRVSVLRLTIPHWLISHRFLKYGGASEKITIDTERRENFACMCRSTPSVTHRWMAMRTCSQNFVQISYSMLDLSQYAVGSP